MSETILPEGEALRRAVRWLSEQRQEHSEASLTSLIEGASLRFDLSPLESQFLLDYFAPERRDRGEGEGAAPEDGAG